ncbi:MAG: hypothetical protein JSV38_00955 [Desulfobacterales bacterium]|nr:MAG: hypothetical protein JSV38_00955 [Desulfobacterales bacterium]
MTEINYKALKNYLHEQKQHPGDKGFAPVYLIYGEELMYKTAFEALLNALIPEAKRSLNYDSIEGSGDHIQEAIEKVNTYSLMPGKRVVAINDAKIFYSKQDETHLLKRSKDAFDSQDTDKAAKFFLNFLGLSNLSFDDIAGENRSKVLNFDAEQMDNDEWIDQIIAFCKAESLNIPSVGNIARLVEDAIQKGFPEGNHLIITTDIIDKRRRLFKVIKHQGVVVDCSVPKGERRADKIAQKAALNDRMNEILSQFDATIDKDAYQAVIDMTGFDLRTFSNSIHKLVSYVADRKKITAKDVKYVLKRTKKDPLFELTNAVSDRDIERSLFFLDSLLTDLIHPLQILATITNQMRKLLLLKGFCESTHGRFWQTGYRFDQFKRRTMPAIQAFDNDLLNELTTWDRNLANDIDPDDQGKKKKRSKKKHKPDTDLIISKQPQNPYPVFQMLLKSENFTTKELIAVLEVLSQADLQLKSTRQSPKLILEDVVFRICSSNIS